MKDYSPRLAAANMPATELADTPATVKASVLTRELCFLMWEKYCLQSKVLVSLTFRKLLKGLITSNKYAHASYELLNQR